MAFLYSGSWWFLCIVEVSPCGWGWMSVVKVSWLGKLALVFWWVELYFFSLGCNEVSSSEVWDVYGLGVALGSLYITVQSYVPLLLENLHGMSFSGTCWLLDGAWFQCSYGGFWMSSYRLMFPGVRGSLVFSGFGFKPLAPGFQSYSFSSLKTSPSMQHQWWKSRLIGEKILHSEGHPERFVELHGE